MLKGGDSGPTIFPGDALASLLFQAIDPGHTELEMPPKREPVSEAERSVISSWINESTAWPSAPTGEVTEEVFNDEDRE